MIKPPGKPGIAIHCLMQNNQKGRLFCLQPYFSLLLLGQSDLDTYASGFGTRLQLHACRMKTGTANEGAATCIKAARATTRGKRCINLGPCPAETIDLYMQMCRYIYTHKLIYICMNVCTYVRTYVRTYVCMYVCMFVCMYVCMHACMCVCMHICVYLCVCVCVCVCVYVYVYVYVCTYAHMYISIYVCIYVYIYM